MTERRYFLILIFASLLVASMIVITTSAKASVQIERVPTLLTREQISWCENELKGITDTYNSMRAEDIKNKFQTDDDKKNRMKDYDVLVNRIEIIVEKCTYDRITAKALMFRTTIHEETFNNDNTAIDGLWQVYRIYYKGSENYYGVKYPDIGEDSLFRVIKLYHKSGLCVDFMRGYKEYIAEFPNGRESYRKSMAVYFDDCITKHEEIEKKTILLTSGSRPKAKAKDILVLGYDFKDAAELEDYARNHFIKALFFVPEWEALAKQEYKDKINIYMYSQILQGDDCKAPNEAEENCACNEKKINYILSMIGADNYFVLMKGEPGTWCRGNADFNKGARVFIFDMLKDENGNEYKNYVIPKDYPTYFDEAGNPIDVEGMNANTMHKLYNYNEIVILHESGHLLYDLQDEYVQTKSGDHPKEPNCADNEEIANKWWAGISYSGPDISSLHPALRMANEIGMFKGCSYVEKNFRPVNNSIMNDQVYFSLANQKASFGPVNDRQIRKILDAYT